MQVISKSYAKFVGPYRVSNLYKIEQTQVLCFVLLFQVRLSYWLLKLKTAGKLFNFSAEQFTDL